MRNLRGSVIHRAGHDMARALRVRAPAPRTWVPYLRDVVAEPDGGVTRFEEVVPACIRDPGDGHGALPFNLDDDALYTFPAAYVAELKGAGVVAHGVRLRDGRLVGDLSVEPYARPHEVAEHSLMRRRSLPRARYVRGTSVGVVSAFGDNWFHWLLEVVPRLQLLRTHSADALAAADRLLLNVELNAWQLETLDLLDLTARVAPTGNGAISTDEMLVPSLAGIQVHPPPWACAYTRSALLPPTPPERGRRLYISRAGASRRRVTNELEVLRALDSLGFEVIVTAELSVAEEAATFAAASVVVGLHGAELANTVFCAPETRLVELFPGNYATSCYWLMAHHLRMAYGWQICEPVASEERPGDVLAADARVDVGALLRTLESLGVE